MPTYEYKCGNCQEVVEIFQSITASPVRKCPQCGKLKLKRMLGTGAGLIFKGSGFYETDYRSDSYKKAAQSDSSASTGEKKEAKTETKTETKSETKTETKSEAKKDSGSVKKDKKTA
jgi:putative FmdB family regulatory protein